MDMIGNVDEWCRDWYQDDYYAKSPSKNPSGPSKGSIRVFRGGAWVDGVRYCRSAYRGFVDPDVRRDYLGFRLVLLPGQQG
jgi:formylglycine-generating enzyme required for sulfatase activity